MRIKYEAKQKTKKLERSKNKEKETIPIKTSLIFSVNYLHVFLMFILKRL